MKRKIIVTTNKNIVKEVVDHLLKNKDKNIANLRNFGPKFTEYFNKDFNKLSGLVLAEDLDYINSDGEVVELPPTNDLELSNNIRQLLKASNTQELLVIGDVTKLREYEKVAKEMKLDLVAITAVGYWFDLVHMCKKSSKELFKDFDITITEDIVRKQDNVTNKKG